MGQQPNIELSESDRPRRLLEPPPATAWHPTKPGSITSPEDLPRGGWFGSAGPDAGWALHLISRAELTDSDPRLRKVLEGLVTARAAALGRAPVPEDIEAGLMLCGYGFEASPAIKARRERWLAAVAHEQRPGTLAVSEVDPDLIIRKPEQIRWALGHLQKPDEEPSPPVADRPAQGVSLTVGH